MMRWSCTSGKRLDRSTQSRKYARVRLLASTENTPMLPERALFWCDEKRMSTPLFLELWNRSSCSGDLVNHTSISKNKKFSPASTRALATANLVFCTEVLSTFSFSDTPSKDRNDEPDGPNETPGPATTNRCSSPVAAIPPPSSWRQTASTVKVSRATRKKDPRKPTTPLAMLKTSSVMSVMYEASLMANATIP